MANILEFLRGVLTDAEIRGAFQTDPTGFLQRTGFGDLTGEDVAEAIAVVRRSLPEPAASALRDFEDDDDFSAVRPQAGERELDAAARVLLYAVDQVPTPTNQPAPAAPAAAAPAPAQAPAQPPAPPRAEPRADPRAEPTSRQERRQQPEGGQPPDPRRRPEPARATAPAPSAPPQSRAPEAAPPRPPAPTTTRASREPSVGLPNAPSIEAFGETMTALVAETKSRLTEVLRQAANDADRIRTDAEAEVGKLRLDASADRDTARDYLERTQVEADAVLAKANATLEEARRQADELISSSRAETEGARKEIDARRSELRDAERQLRERFQGVEALFRTVLRDDEPPADGPGGPPSTASTDD